MKIFPRDKYYTKTFHKDPFPLKMLYEWEPPIQAGVVFSATTRLESRAIYMGQIIFLEKKRIRDERRCRLPALCYKWRMANQGPRLRFKGSAVKEVWFLSWRNSTQPASPVQSSPDRSDIVRATNGNEFIYVTEISENLAGTARCSVSQPVT